MLSLKQKTKKEYATPMLEEILVENESLMQKASITLPGGADDNPDPTFGNPTIED